MLMIGFLIILSVAHAPLLEELVALDALYGSLEARAREVSAA
jgi:hypothetical protein